MTNNTHPCDYAFPVAPGDEPYWQPGMTLRDWFAGQALSGDMTTYPDNDAAEYAQEIAKRCYAVADAMLAARAKGGA